MMQEENEFETFETGDRFVLKINHPVDFQGEAESDSGHVVGEMELRIDYPMDQGAYVSVTRLGASGVGAKFDDFDMGMFGFYAVDGSGTVARQDDLWHIDVDMQAETIYERLSLTYDIEQVNEDRFRSRRETFNAYVSGEAQFLRSPSHDEGNAISSLHMELNYEAGGFGNLRSIQLNLNDASFVRAFTYGLPGAGEEFVHHGMAEDGDPADDGFDAEEGDEIEQSDTWRSIMIQPVHWQAHADDPDPTGGAIDEQIRSADAIWNKACIGIKGFAPLTLTDSDLKTSSSAGALWRALADHYAAEGATWHPQTVILFVVSNDLSRTNGAYTIDEDTPLAKIVFSNDTANENLLAHEIGHILAGLHPSSGTPPDGFWFGEPRTVMDIVSAGDNTPERNTFHNCSNVGGPLLRTILGMWCTLAPD